MGFKNKTKKLSSGCDPTNNLEIYLQKLGSNLREFTLKKLKYTS